MLSPESQAADAEGGTKFGCTIFMAPGVYEPDHLAEFQPGTCESRITTDCCSPGCRRCSEAETLSVATRRCRGAIHIVPFR
ncbi:hypothetical protein M514_27674 [Trichuris suis]|uniref:Uncharacterized protein n=1 Tax=Trichuris suis TaxID=68888 RepID=A0A085MSF0_9BILA|nr:hypothetical protein M514_27674 [Trichuris suis]